MATTDRQITTWLSKQVVFDYNDIQNISAGESAYFIVCIHPDALNLLLSTLNFYADWPDRWINFPSEMDKVDLIARANTALMAPMACSEDVQLIIDNLASIALTQTEIRDRLGDSGQSVAGELALIKAELQQLVTAVTALDPSLFNQIEETLNGVGVILGAPAITLD